MPTEIKSRYTKNEELASALSHLIGGFLYTSGIFFFRFGRFKYHHLVWHLLVLAGAVFHFIAIYYFVLPISV